MRMRISRGCLLALLTVPFFATPHGRVKVWVSAPRSLQAAADSVRAAFGRGFFADSLFELVPPNAPIISRATDSSADAARFRRLPLYLIRGIVLPAAAGTNPAI